MRCLQDVGVTILGFLERGVRVTMIRLCEVNACQMSRMERKEGNKVHISSRHDVESGGKCTVSGCQAALQQMNEPGQSRVLVCCTSGIARRVQNAIDSCNGNTVACLKRPRSGRKVPLCLVEAEA